jgi:hypothetical protein
MDEARERQLAEALAHLMDGEHIAKPLPARRAPRPGSDPSPGGVPSGPGAGSSKYGDAATLSQFPELAGELDALAEIDRAIEPDLALPERLSGHKILAEIGAGGMGQVLLAQDEAIPASCGSTVWAPPRSRRTS